MILRRIVERAGGHEAGDVRETASRDIEATSELAQQAAPVAEPAEGSLHEPTPL